MPQSTALLVPPQRTPCAPWCTRHDVGENACYANPTPSAGQAQIGLSRHLDGTVIDLYRTTDTPLTLDQAEQLGRALLATVAAVRGTGVSP